MCIRDRSDPVEKSFEMEDLHVKQKNARMSVDSDTLYACFLPALPAAEYSLEIRDLDLRQVYGRKQIINLFPSRYETLRSSFGKSKGSSKSLTLVGKGGSGYGGKGGKAHGKGKGGNGNTSSNGGAGKAEGPMRRCFRCKLRATTATVAPQSSAKGVVGEDTRAVGAHRRRT